MLAGKFPISFLAVCLVLSGCDSNPQDGQTTVQATGIATDPNTNIFDPDLTGDDLTGDDLTGDGLAGNDLVEDAGDDGPGFQLPERIRTSLAVDFSQVEGIATVNGRLHQMERFGNRFRVQVPDIPANSPVSFDLLFREILPDGQVLNLAQTDTQVINTTSTNETIEVLEAQFDYGIDDDNDGINNINERNDGTDPFVPQNTGNRIITVEFNLPQRIQDPVITRVTALIADRSSAFSRQVNFVRATGLVPNGSTVDIDIRLDQLFDGTPIPIAQALDQVQIGNQNETVLLTDSDFSFDLDRDNDGVTNIDEIQSGRDPFLAE